MSVNRDRPHILVLTEDHATRQLATGFLLGINEKKQRNIQMLKSSGGWLKVLKELVETHVTKLENNPNFHLVLLIDFDDLGDSRRNKFTDVLPADVRNRVYVLGTSAEPENLRKALKFRKSLEDIGTTLANECRTGNYCLWDHAHLQHNAEERARFSANARSIVF